MSKVIALLAGGVGYILGARAGRERYDQIEQQARRLWHDPRVQEKKSEAQAVARDKASEVQDKASEKASQVQEKASQRTSTGAPSPADMPADPAAPAAPAQRPGTGGPA